MMSLYLIVLLAGQPSRQACRDRLFAEGEMDGAPALLLIRSAVFRLRPVLVHHYKLESVLERICKC